MEGGRWRSGGSQWANRGGRLFGEPGGEKELFGWYDSLEEPEPVKSGVLVKMGEICPWTTFSGGNRLESADGGF